MRRGVSFQLSEAKPATDEMKMRLVTFVGVTVKEFACPRNEIVGGGEGERSGSLGKAAADKATEFTARLERMFTNNLCQRVGKNNSRIKSPLRKARGAAKVQPYVRHSGLRQSDRICNSILYSIARRIDRSIGRELNRDTVKADTRLVDGIG